MRNLLVLIVIAGSVMACETHGVVDSTYESTDGSHVSLRQFKNESRFYYSLSASMPSGDGSIRELRVVAMGADGHVRFRFGRAPAVVACDS